jgi:hypothetical protein
LKQIKQVPLHGKQKPTAEYVHSAIGFCVFLILFLFAGLRLFHGDKPASADGAIFGAVLSGEWAKLATAAGTLFVALDTADFFHEVLC